MNAPDYLRTEQTRQLVRATPPRGKLGKRDRALLLTLLDAGLRPIEAAGLRMDDVDHEAGTLRVTTAKQRGKLKRRVLPMTERMHDALREWIEVKPTGEWLFCNVSHSGVAAETEPGGQISTRMIHKTIRKLGKRVDLHATPVLLRHTYATRLVHASVRLDVVQRMMGHANIQTTLDYYAGIAPGELGDVRDALGA